MWAVIKGFGWHAIRSYYELERCSLWWHLSSARSPAPVWQYCHYTFWLLLRSCWTLPEEPLSLMSLLPTSSSETLQLPRVALFSWLDLRAPVCSSWGCAARSTFISWAAFCSPSADQAGSLLSCTCCWPSFKPSESSKAGAWDYSPFSLPLTSDSWWWHALSRVGWLISLIFGKWPECYRAGS